jgi:hypothetical protein
MILARKKKPLRLSSLDYISSLVRSEAYVNDYEKYLAAHEMEKDERQRALDFLSSRFPLLMTADRGLGSMRFAF